MASISCQSQLIAWFIMQSHACGANHTIKKEVKMTGESGQSRGGKMATISCQSQLIAWFIMQLHACGANHMIKERLRWRRERAIPRRQDCLHSLANHSS